MKKINSNKVYVTWDRMKKQGKTMKQISVRLGMPIPTIYYHLKKVESKAKDIKLESMPFRTDAISQDLTGGVFSETGKTQLLNFIFSNERIKQVIAEELVGSLACFTS